MREQAKTPKGKKTAKATTGLLAEANPSRQGLIITNPSSREVWLALGETAAKEEGPWLKKESGQIWIGPEWTGPVACITTEGEGSITFAEF